MDYTADTRRGDEDIQVQRKRKKRSLIHHFLTVIGTILTVILLPILIINLTFIVRSALNEEKIPSLAGYFPLVVLTDSMSGTVDSGDLVIYHTVDAANVEVGDVIAFFDPAGDGTSVVTHRVVEITEQDGALAFRTKGDASDVEDTSLVPAENLAGIFRTRFDGAGHIALFLQSRTGIIVCVVLPLLMLLCYDLVRRRMYDRQRKADTDALLAELKELRAGKR
jgi:signal peptidase